MKSDIQIQKDVLDELKWEPFLSDSEIMVSVEGGVVTISGLVDTYSKKMTAEKAVQKVVGVKGVTDKIEVNLVPALQKTDTEITEAVRHALKWHTGVQEERINVKVENGEVTLEGETEWEYQRNQAQTAVENVMGVRSVVNLITLKPKISAADVQEQISAAFHRSASIDSCRIKVEVEGSKVILHGTIRSFAEKREAEAAAWNAPGVISVESRLEIEEPDYTLEED